MKYLHQSTKIFSAFIISCTVLFSCKSLDTTVSVPSRAIPLTFSERLASDTVNIATVPWREYFRDSLLVRLIDTALANNFDLQTVLERIQIANANAQFTRGELLPKVIGSIGGGVRKYGLYTMDGAGNISTEILPGKIVPVDLPDLSIGVQTAWEVDIWGKLRSKNEAAAAQYLASIEGTRFVATSLIAEVAETYFDLVALDNELDIVRRTIQKHREALNTIELQKEAGRANELAVQQFEAQVLSLQVQERETLHHITLLENRLNMLLGRFPQTILRQRSALAVPVPEQISSGLPAQLLANRPDIREAELHVRASKFDVEAAKAAFFPSLTLSAGIGFQAFDPQLLFLSPASIAYNALGGLVAPLVNWQGLEAQFSAAKSQQKQALYRYQQSIVHGFTEVVNELSALENLRQINALKTQENAVLKESEDIAAELYKSAKATYLEVLLAQENALHAQLQLVNIRKRQQIALVHLYKALGGGWR
ncbi:MAG: efflux transporter outer membrane subunit [Candidatus Kapabacteria bacterium]|jgi:NodT family efflux transporter outer membrane factor (OMF) lipoprotein|nr:efflux transporter outer membrane subunit [Candidatus Kapabacteria bacterium]